MGNLSASGVHSLLELQHVIFLHKVCERTSQDFLWQCKNIAVTDGLHTNGFFLIKKCLFSPLLWNHQPIPTFSLSHHLQTWENKTLFVCFLYLIGDQSFSSLVVLQVKRTADTLLATAQGGFFLFVCFSIKHFTVPALWVISEIICFFW